MDRDNQIMAGDDTIRGEPGPEDALTARLSQAKLTGLTLEGRYLIKRSLGQGGFGAVYLAVDQKMVSRKVVVKVLHDETAKNAWVVTKFKQEIEALTRINHPGVVGVFDTGRTPEGQPFIIMQYVDGVTLRSQITPEGMPFWRAAKIFSQIGRALNAAHQVGILHRDLKPENVMLETLTDDDEHVKIIDFGIAKIKNSIVSHSTIEAQSVGTLYYMSPEQLSAQPLTPASDVYSLGVIAYETLTGRRPINPDSVFQILELQRSGVRVKPTDLRPGLPPGAELAILKALSFEAQDRYQSARDFADVLASALIGDDDPTRRQTLVREEEVPEAAEIPNASAPVTGKPEAPAKYRVKSVPSTYNRPLVAAVLLLVLGLFVTGIWYALRSKTPATAQTKPVTVAPLGPERSLTYWLTVQMSDGGKAIESAGQEIYRNGSHFQFNIEPSQEGALYLLNAGPGKQGLTEYNVLFPTPGNNEGVAQVAANQKVQTRGNYFNEHPGVEKLWIIWAARTIPELDQIFREAASHDGVITDEPQLAKVAALLKTYESAPPKVKSDKASNRTLITGPGDMLVQLVELSHRDYK